MKKSLPLIQLLLFALIFPAVAAGASVRATVAPASFEAGDSVMYRLHIEFDDSDGPLSDLKLPQSAGVVISSQPSERRQNSFTFNGKSSGQLLLGFALRADKSGEYLLPPAELKAGTKVIKSNSVRFTVTPAAPETLPPPGEIARLPERKFYVGEVLPLAITFRVPGIALNAGNLSVSGGNALAMPLFADDFQTEGDRNETIIRTRYYLQLLAPGSGELSFRLPIRYRNRRNRLKMSELTTLPVKLTVLPRPAAPAELIDTGLNGKWNFSLTLTKNPCEVGSSTTLQISASPTAAVGNGALHAHIKAPQLSVPDCRVFPGKVLRRNGQLLFEYQVVPLKNGRIVTTLPLACFDVDSGKYQPCQLPLFLLVTGTAPAVKTASPPPAPISPAPAASPGDTGSSKAKLPPAADRAGIPLQTGAAESNFDYPPVAVPLYRNSLPWIIFSALLLLLLLAVRLFCRYRQEFGKRRQQRALLAGLCSELAAAEGNILPVLEKHGISGVAVAMGLPPGATAADIAAKLADEPELQQIFSAVADAAYQGAGENSFRLPPEKIQQLIKFIKSLMLWMLLFLVPLSLPAAEKVSPRQLAETAAALEQQQDLPRARLYWMRAHLLAPGSREIAEKLVSNGKALNLPAPEADFSTPFVRLRDLRRPDHYLSIAAVLVMILCGVWVWRKRFSRSWFRVITVAAALLLLLAVTAFASQSAGTYSAKQLMLVTAQPKLCAAPVADAAVTGQPQAGSTAELLEKRGDWLHIRCADGSTGWISARQVQQVFPYGIW